MRVVAAERPSLYLRVVRSLFLLLTSLAVLGTPGCAFKGGDDTQGERPNGVGDAWRPAVVAMRVYPTTRFIMREGRALLEARVELFDEMGDPLKASGVYSFELVEDGGPLGDVTTLYQWSDVTVTSLADQQTFYDPISRGYRFLLRLDDLELAERGVRLIVTVTTPDGRRIVARRDIRPPGR